MPRLSEGSDGPYITREMGLDHAEFRRVLPRVAGTAPITQVAHPDGGLMVTLDIDAQRQICFEVGPEGQRHIAGVSLPMTVVTLRFRGYERREAEATLGKIDIQFQRGGG